jgi:hypothetical protein
MFVVASKTTGLNLAKIFSVLEITTTLKMTILLVVLGVGLYYEIKVVFSRFASIFNLEEKAMLRID